MKRADEEELAVIAEIARMYYVEGMSQQEIANMLFFSKAKVSRALKIAREEKIVEFQIHYPLKQSVASGDRTKAQIWTERSTGGRRPL